MHISRQKERKVLIFSHVVFAVFKKHYHPVFFFVHQPLLEGIVANVLIAIAVVVEAKNVMENVVVI